MSDRLAPARRRRPVDGARRRPPRQPGDDRQRMRGGGSRAPAVLRRLRARRGRHQVDHARPAVRAGRRRGWSRRRRACSTRSACRARASTRSWRATCRGCCSTTPGRSSRSPGRRWGSTPSSPAGSATHRASRRSRSTSRARTSRTAASSSPATRSRRRRVIAAVRRDTPRGVPVFAKLSPDVTSIVEIAESVIEAGADGLVMINTLLGLHIDLDTMRPHARRGDRRALRPGGPTGRRPRGLAGGRRRMPGVPIIGVGGIRTGADALEFIAAGACAVQVGTAIFNDPTAPIRVVRELRARARGSRHRARSATRSACRAPQSPTHDDATARHDTRRQTTVMEPFGSSPPRRRWTPAASCASASTRTRACWTAWGLDDDLAGLERFAMTVRRGARRPRSPCSSRSRRSSSGTGRAGIAVLEKAVAGRARAGRTRPARRQAWRHRLDHAGVRRGLPRPVVAAGGRRDDGQPLPRLRVAAAGARHGVGARGGRLRARR